MEISGNKLLEIGRGAFGNVYTLPESNKIVKIMDPFSKIDERYIYDIGTNELFIDRFDEGNLSCNPLILQEAFFSSINDPRIVSSNIGKYNDQYCLISDFAGISLDILRYDNLSTRTNKETIFTFYAYHIIMAIGTIEKHGIAHRDYHMGNFTIDITDKTTKFFDDNVIFNQNDKQTDHIRVIDFGMAKFSDRKAIKYSLKTLIKTLISLKWYLYQRESPNAQISDFISLIISRPQPSVQDMIDHTIFDQIKNRYNENYNFSIDVNRKYIPWDIILDQKNKAMADQYFIYMKSQIKVGSKWCILLAEEIFLNYISKNGVKTRNDSIIYSAVSLFIAMKITLSIYDNEDAGLRVIDLLLRSIGDLQVSSSKNEI